MAAVGADRAAGPRRRRLAGLSGLPLAAAVLLGACMAPTDPVLAAEVQVGPPGHGATEGSGKEEDEVRFALTSEAGLNDGLAFPVANLAILLALGVGDGLGWLGEWALVDVVYRLAAGTLGGLLLGWGLARVLLARSEDSRFARSLEGPVSLAATLAVYALVETVGGYGFLAVFVSACAFREYEREHAYHSALHDFVEDVERLLMAAVLVLLGGAVVGGLLAPLTWQLVVLAALTLLVVRPAAGLLALAGRGVGDLRERGAIAFFGIRGIGSLYYLSHASVEAEFPRLPELWAVVGLVVVASVLLHGVTAGPATSHLDRRRGEGALRRPAHLADDPLHADADWRA